MRNAKRALAEFGNYEDDARNARVVVEIGDGAKLSNKPRTINYTVDGTASHGDGKDYTIDGCEPSPVPPTTCTVKLPANRHSAVITININNDGLDENDETIILTLKGGTDYTLNAQKTTTLTIRDDDTRGLTFHRRWPDVPEGGSQTYTVKLKSQPTAAVTVNIASDNPDVTVTPTSLTFNPSGSNLWSRARTVTIDAAQDSDAVDDEATLTHTTSGGDYGGANALSIGRSVSVDDDDPRTTTVVPQLPRISLTGGAAVTEGAAASFTVNADRAPTARLTVNLEVVEPGGGDFVAASEEGVRTVTLNAGATSTTFTVPTVNDNTEEVDGAVLVLVNAGTGYSAGDGDLVNVNDNDGGGPPPTTPAASFASASSSAAENAGTRNVRVNLSPAAPSGGLTLSYSVSGTATAGSGNDFTIAGSGTLSVGAGATTADIPVAINDDSSTESAETVILTLTSDTGYTLGSTTVHTLTITDNDAPTPTTPAASFASAASSAAESAGTRNVRVNLSSSAPLGGLTLAYSVSGTATAGSGNDFTIAGSGTLTVGAGATTATIPVAINDDSSTESAETVILTLIGGTGYTLGNPRGHTLTITDNDDPTPTTPAASFASAASSAAENAGTRNVMVNLSSAAPSGGLTLGYNVSGTATAGSGNDFTIQNSGTLTVAAGATSATIPVAINDDSIAESAETVILTLTGGTDYTLGSQTVHTLTITDNDDPTPTTPAASFASASSSAAESAGTRNVRVNLSSSAPLGGLTLAYSVSGTATAGSGNDFTIQNSGTLTVAAGATSATIPVAINDDSIAESAETVILTLTGGTDYTLGSQTVHTLTITDNDGPPPGTPALVISKTTVSVSEGGTGSYTVQLATEPTGTVTVNIASDNTDVTVSPAPLTFNPSGNNLWSTAQTVTVSAAQDSDALDDTATLTHTATGYGTVPAASVTVTVNDDETTTPTTPTTPPTTDPPDETPTTPTGPEITVQGGSAVTEGGDAVFTISANPAPASALTVTLTVADDANSDFLAQADEGEKTVTIAGGETSATLTVPTQDDSQDEADGSVTATLQADADYTLASPSTAMVAIADNDPTPAIIPVVGIAGGDAITGGGTARFTLTASPAPTGSITVRVRIESSNIRVPGGQAGLRTVTIGSSGTATLTVTTIDDDMVEAGGTITVTVRAGPGYRVAAADAASVRVVTPGTQVDPAAWLARFGRMVAGQALDGITGRMAAARRAGLAGSIGGRALGFGPGPTTGAGGTGAAPESADVLEGGGPVNAVRLSLSHMDRMFGTGRAAGASRSLTGRDLMLGSRFTLTGERDAMGGSLAFWGQAAQSGFDGREGRVSLDGEATTAMLGADYARDRWLAGMALMQSDGKGDYRDTAAGAGSGSGGDVETTLTAALPYASLQVSERMKLWGALGHGTGEVTLKPEPGKVLTSDLSWTMAATGLRSEVIPPPEEGSGPALALVSDALWAGTSSDKAHELAASDSDVTRLRLGLEGSWTMALQEGGHPGSGSGASLTPKLEAGLRHDDGDAETGFGVELGGGFAWEDPRLGLSLDLSGRMLVTHGADDLEDRGFAASLAFDPDPSTERGLSLALRQERGGQATGGLDALFRADPLRARTGSESDTRWTAEAAWGFPALGRRFTGSPHVGLGLATGGRDYTLGWRLTPEAGALDLGFGVTATRRESDGAAPQHGIGVQLSTRW